MLQGTEVKALRDGRGNINEAYAGEQGGELFLINAYIPEYHAASHFSHDTRRARKLLLHQRELAKLIGAVRKQGQTLIPLSALLQPARPRQDRARPRPRQEDLRQARHASRSATGSARRNA